MEELEKYDNNVSEEMLSMIKTSILKFKTTILDLTEIAKVQKQFETETDKVNLSEILDEVLLNINNTIIESKAEIKVDLKDCCLLNFSRKNIRSIFYNLISNAIKYHSPDRKPVIHIKTQIIDNFCLLSVQDNGLGFDEDQTDKIFIMFKRLHTHVEGTGVGLYIVKRIIENAGGKIEVESKKGVGSIFKVYFKIV